jgi:hypothetical protein
VRLIGVRSVLMSVHRLLRLLPSKFPVSHSEPGDHMRLGARSSKYTKNLKLIGASYEDDYPDNYGVGSRVLRICFHRDTKLGRYSVTSHYTAWPLLPVI